MSGEPRTKAGRALMANLEPRWRNLPWDQVSYDLTLEEVLDIEVEAAQPSQPVLRAALERLVHAVEREHGLGIDYPTYPSRHYPCEICDATERVRAALASESGESLHLGQQVAIKSHLPKDLEGKAREAEGLASKSDEEGRDG